MNYERMQGMISGAGAECQQVPPMEESRHRMMRATERLHGAINALEKKVEDYIIPTGPQTAAEANKAIVPVQSPMVHFLNERADEIMSLAERIEDLNMRLQ